MCSQTFTTLVTTFITFVTFVFIRLVLLLDFMGYFYRIPSYFLTLA